MDWGNQDRAELAVDMAAATIFAVAVGFSLWAVGSDGGVTTVVAAGAFLVAISGLRRISPEVQAHALPKFLLETFEPAQDVADELILDDELGEVGPDARVVRLFGPSQSHLPSNYRSPALPDASQALVEALAELRRSLY
ncbi:hypothetical protein [Sphingomonas sp.]|uniref:hypothetical protein n=1 Tax=Sphingomonas sp. TaxID=28214 RepID=UPI00286D5EDA|nr:hypothetical protein [Sphingomonas sp.]